MVAPFSLEMGSAGIVAMGLWAKNNMSKHVTVLKNELKLWHFLVEIQGVGLYDAWGCDITIWKMKPTNAGC